MGQSNWLIAQNKTKQETWEVFHLINNTHKHKGLKHIYLGVCYDLTPTTIIVHTHTLTKQHKINLMVHHLQTI
jgi:hypothetical protein